MTNWYQIFYWLTVADGIKNFFDGVSTFFTAMAVVTIILFIICSIVETGQLASYGEDDEDYKIAGIWKKNFKAFAILSFIFMVITWTVYVAIPTKKDALIIIAGGAVGNFVTQDSSAKKIPSEVMLLLRTKIKEEINSASIKDAINGDELKNKSKEELIKMLEEQNNGNSGK